MADILFIEAFWLALFNDKVEFIGFFLAIFRQKH